MWAYYIFEETVICVYLHLAIFDVLMTRSNKIRNFSQRNFKSKLQCRNADLNEHTVKFRKKAPGLIFFKGPL